MFDGADVPGSPIDSGGRHNDLVKTSKQNSSFEAVLLFIFSL
jgi:hypothetical protein